MNKEFFEALALLEKEKGIKMEYMVEKLQTALAGAYKKQMGCEANVRLHVNPDKKEMKLFHVKTVVSEVVDPDTEISLADAKAISRRHKLGGTVETEVKTDKFSRLAAQAGRQQIIQIIREAERANQTRAYEEKKGEVITAVVYKVDETDGSLVLDTGNGRAVLPRAEQLPDDNFTVGDRLKVLVSEVHGGENRGPIVTLSRTHPALVRRLFELEVPEIQDGTVVIKNISRDAGSRTKMSVWSADADVDPEKIVPDTATDENHYDTTEQEGDELCTVLIRYFRKNGEVFCEKATKSVVVNKAFPLTPDYEGALRALSAADGGTSPEGGGIGNSRGEGMDAPNGSAPDNTSGEGQGLRPKGAKAYLYPVVVGQYERREGSIYGLGEVEGLIPNQKAINFNLAMLLLNAQQMAWGKYVVHKDALKGQVITNEPGQTIVDYTGSGQGVKRLAESGSSQQPLQLVETITQLTRSVTGASEVMTGETLGANMSGAAIAQLQSQAQQPIEELRDSFWLVKEKQGRVLAQFFKLFYREAHYTYEQKPSPSPLAAAPLPGGAAVAMPGMMPMQAPPAGTVTQGGKQVVEATFTGADYADVEFDVTCEAMSGTKFSAAGDINILDVLFAKGAISLKTYIQAYPDDALSNKSKLLELIDGEKGDREMQLQQQLQQTQAQLQESAALLEQQKATVDNVVSLIQENNRVKAMLGNLFAEANAKMNEANAQIEAGNARIGEVEGDAQELAGVLSYLEQFKGLPPEAVGEATRYVESIVKMAQMEGGVPDGLSQVPHYDATIAARQHP